MKKALILAIVLALLVQALPVFAAEADTDSSYDYAYLKELSELTAEYDSDTYFSSISVTIGETEIVKDGESIPIDDANTAAYIQNGKTMLPVRVIAEELGAEVAWDQESKSVTVTNEETVVQMTIGSTEIQVNGETETLQTAPEIKNDRTMLPARDVAEALDCEVDWHDSTQTAVITRPLQTKRIIVFSEDADTTGAVRVVKTDGMTVLQFETVEQAENAIAANKSRGFSVEADSVQTITSMSWGADSIGGATYYNETSNSNSGAVVAVVDSGVDYNHSFLSGRIVAGYDVVNGDSYCEDDGGHGTHVAGTIVDIAGSNPSIKIMPVKVFGPGESTPSTIVAEGIRYAVSHGANVINLSLGGQGYSEVEDRAIQFARSKNVAVVAAAGNEKLDLEVVDYSPANLDGVITVSACTKDGKLASFSNYGSGVVDFAAPGVDIESARNGGGYTMKSGTSMATPHVVAVYALAMAAHPDASVDEITAALKKNTVQKGSAREFGAGVIRVMHLEDKMSSFYSEDLTISDITQTSAKFSTVLHYTGILPSKINFRMCLDSEQSVKPVCAADYSVSGKNITVSCDLAKYGVTLTPGTKYYATFGVVQAGNDYVTHGATFTTLPKEEEKEPEKPPVTVEPVNPPITVEPVNPPVIVEPDYVTGVVLIPDNFENLNIRTGPSTGYTTIGHMNHTETCKVYPDKTQNGWYYVNYNGIIGYAAGNYIYLPSETRQGTVSIPSYYDSLNIRTGPSTSYKVLGEMLQGDACTVFPDKTRNGWYFVEYRGIYGYAAGNFINLG